MNSEFEYFLGLCFRCIFQNIDKTKKKNTAQKDNFLQSSNYTIKSYVNSHLQTTHKRSLLLGLGKAT